eukprot:1257595-Amphidinium_carterae.1
MSLSSLTGSRGVLTVVVALLARVGVLRSSADAESCGNTVLTVVSVSSDGLTLSVRSDPPLWFS